MTVGIGGFLTVLGWFLNPCISLILSKFFADLSFDTSRKLRELEIRIIPDLKLMLRDVEKQRMTAAKDRTSQDDLATLNKHAEDLKSALYDAEDMLGLIDYHRIEKNLMGESKTQARSCWLQQILGAAGACIARCKRSWFGRCIDCIRRGVLQCMRLGRFRGRSTSLLPISVVTSSVLGVENLLGWSRRIVLNLSNCYTSILMLLANAVAAARVYRDSSYKIVGIESNQVPSNPRVNFPLLA